MCVNLSLVAMVMLFFVHVNGWEMSLVLCYSEMISSFEKNDEQSNS